MADWRDVFCDERVRADARRRVRQAVVAFALGSGLAVSAAPLSALAWPHAATAVAIGCGLVLTVLAGATLRAIDRAHRTVWRVELTSSQIVGVDVAGHRTSISWPSLTTLDVRTSGLVCRGRNEQGHAVRITVGRSMPRFTMLGHRAVRRAEAFGCALWVDGKPWERLDLNGLYRREREDSAPTV